jgi:hypothetical protein
VVCGAKVNKRDRECCSQQCQDSLDVSILRWGHRALASGRLAPPDRAQDGAGEAMPMGA